MLASETKTSIEIIDAEAKKQVIQRENIDELTASTKSLMPEGFEKQFKDNDLVNLLEFLTQKRQIPADAARQGGHHRQDQGDVLRRRARRPNG